MDRLGAQRSGTVDTAKPVLRSAVSADHLVSMLRTALDSMDIPRIRRNDHSMAIRRLEEYLRAAGSDTVNVDERMVEGFEAWLAGRSESGRATYAPRWKCMSPRIPCSTRPSTLPS